MTCTVCGKPKYKKQWCNAHYIRWRRHGDPLGGGAAWGDHEKFVQAVLEGESESCINWPFGKSNGYPALYLNGVQLYGHSYICEKVNGPKPDNSYEAAHSCGNSICMNKRHIRWATQSQNQMDRVDHGTSNRGEQNGQVKITQEQAQEIKSLKGIFSARELGEQFGISRQAVNDIFAGRTWAWL